MNWVLTSEKVNDVKGLLDVSHGHLLFTIVSSLHHDGVDESLNDWAINFLKTSFLVLSSGVWEEYLTLLRLHIQVGVEGNIGALNSFVGVLSEKFGLNSIFSVLLLLLSVSSYSNKHKVTRNVGKHLLST